MVSARQGLLEKPAMVSDEKPLPADNKGIDIRDASESDSARGTAATMATGGNRNTSLRQASGMGSNVFRFTSNHGQPVVPTGHTVTPGEIIEEVKED